MTAVPNHALIVVTAEDVKKARDFYGLTDVKMINESLDAVEEWCQKQDHLGEACKHLDRNILERIFILAKGSVEATKKKIDKLFTSRGMMSDLCLNRSLEEFEILYADVVNYVPLPKLCPTDQSRVMVTQFKTGNLDEFSVLNYLRYCFMIGEYRLHCDYSLCERYIIDLKNVHVGFISKLNPITMKKAEVLCTEGYGTKIKGIHIVNAPPFVDKILFLLKQALREKVASRLHVHQTYEDLHQHIPKEVLPKDYDGDAPYCSKLAEQWTNILKTKEAIKIIEELDKLVTDESKRTSAKFNEEYLGMPGSFRRLAVD